MDQELTQRLQKAEHDEELDKLLRECVDLVARSRSDRSKCYPNWDRNLEIYKGIRPPDKDDLEAAKNREPEKMIVPMTFAQVQTFVAFCYLLYYQNSRFYQLNPTGPEDYQWREAAELCLERDLRANLWPSKLYQLLVDTARFSIGVTKHWWATEKKHLPQLGGVSSAQGMPTGGMWAEATIYEGNRITNISPYHFFPDTRVPLSDWRRGEFAADEKEYTKNELEQLEEKGVVAGVSFIPDLQEASLGGLKTSRLPAMIDFQSNGKIDKNKCNVVEIQRDLVPSKYGLGPENFHVRYLLWYANDKRIIRIERMGYAHLDFTYDVAHFAPDMHLGLGMSLADVIFNIQDVITWLINSRIWSVKQSIEGKLVVDAEGIDIASLENRKSRVIYTKRSAARVGLDNYIKQLDFVDTTGNHFSDVTFLNQLINAVSGINENAMGQFHPGRRSATEARAVQAGAAGRLKLQAALIWADAIAPQGRKLYINQRQALSFDSFSEIVGVTDPLLQLKYQSFHAQDIGKLARSEDFFVFDGTLESEKGFLAQSIQELVGVILSNPESAQLFNLNPATMIQEIMELRGVGNISRFSFTPNGTGLINPNGGAPGAQIIAPGAPQLPGLPTPTGAVG